jgi:succinate dehydrogenase/fumarate reductase flavoprotein subunit
VREKLRETMWEYVGLERSEKGLKTAIKTLNELKETVESGLDDEYGLRPVLEVRNMVEVAIAVARSALYRTESRGAHYRSDYPERDDKRWLRHTVYRPDGSLATRPVKITRLDPRR